MGSIDWEERLKLKIRGGSVWDKPNSQGDSGMDWFYGQDTLPGYNYIYASLLGRKQAHIPSIEEKAYVLNISSFPGAHL